MSSGTCYRAAVSTAAMVGVMTLGPWAALPAAASPGHAAARVTSTATLDGVGDVLFPMFGIGKPTITVEPQPGTFPADSPPDLNGLQVDLSFDVAGEPSETTCVVTAGQPGAGTCDALVPVDTDLTVTIDPNQQLPAGFLFPAPLTLNIADCDPGGEGPVPCPASPIIQLPGTWRPVGLAVTNAETGDPVTGAEYTLCAPAATASGDCPAGTAAVGSATSGADGTLQFPGLYQGSPDYQVVPTSVPSAFVSPSPQPLAVPAVDTLAEVGTLFRGQVALTPKAPTAAADTATLPEDSSVDIAVLTNDNTSVGDLTVQDVTQPDHGTVAVGSGGVVTYTPATGFVGSDHFNYKAVNDFGGSADAAVTVTVTDVPPTLKPVQLHTDQNVAVSFDAISRAAAAKGNTVHVSAVGTAHHGSAVIAGDGTVTYTPGHDYAGTDSFTYTVADNHGGSATAVVTVTIAAAASPTTPSTTEPASPAGTSAPLAVSGTPAGPGTVGLGLVLVAAGAALAGLGRRRPARHRR